MVQRRRNPGKTLSGLLILPLLLSVIATACGEPEPAQSTGESADGSQAPLEVSIMVHFFGETPPDPNGEVQKLIEKATNSKMTINWVSSNNYDDKLNVTIASGDIPDLVLIKKPFDPAIRNVFAQGAFWDLTPYYKNYPNLVKGIPETAWELTKMQDGKNYGVPRPRGVTGQSFFNIRKDWLDKLGLEIPKTDEDLYKVMEAFTNKDPDGNGKKDTIGFTGYVYPDSMGSFDKFESVFTHSHGVWKADNGQLVYANFLPEEREALQYLAKAYKEGLLPADFASLQVSQAKDLYKAEKAGIISEDVGGGEYLGVMHANNPKITYESFYPIVINDYSGLGNGFDGMLSIPKKVPEEKMKRILEMLNAWSTPDVYQYQKWGIEGRHFTVKDGKKVVNSDLIQKEGIGNFSQIVNYLLPPTFDEGTDYNPVSAQQEIQQFEDNAAKTGVPDYSVGLYSKTAQTYLPTINKNTQDLKTKIMLGVEPITAWDDYVAKLQKDPNMTAIIKEMNDSYKARVSNK